MRAANLYFTKHITDNKSNIFNKIIRKKPLRNSRNENDLFAANFSFIARDTFYLLFCSSCLYLKVL